MDRTPALGWLLATLAICACSSDDSDASTSASSEAQTGAGASSASQSSSSGASQGGGGQGGGQTGPGGGGAGGAGRGGAGGQSSGTFACGMMLECKQGIEYCSVFFPGVPDAEPTYTCEALPQGCAPDPACKCIPGSGGGMCGCEESAAGDLTVTCMGI